MATGGHRMLVNRLWPRDLSKEEDHTHALFLREILKKLYSQT